MFNLSNHRWFISFVLLMICTTGVISLGSNEAQAQSEVIVDRIVARVNDTIITQSQVARMLPIYMQVVGPRNRKQLKTAVGREELALDLIQFLIDAELLEKKASDAGIELSHSDIDAYLANYQKQLNMSEPEFRKALEGEGIDYEDYREFMGKYLLRLQMMQAEGIREGSVTDEQVDKVIKQRYPDGFEETYVETSHIFIKLGNGADEEDVETARAKLLAAREKIVAGEATFAELASEINEDSTASKGGELTAFPVADLNESYSRAALALEEGSLSEPVRTSRGLHIIRLDDVEHRVTRNSDKIRQRIRYELKRQNARQQQDAYLQSLRESSFTEVLVDDFNL